MLMAGITDIANLKENFKDKVMEINGDTPVEDNTDYVELVRKLIDPNISDQDVKPLLIQLNTGTLDADQTHLAHIIINCKDASQRKIYLEDFRKSFKKKSWEMDEKKKRRQRKKKKERKKEEGNDKEHLQCDYRTLIDRFLDPKVKKEKKTDIYLKFMEPTVDADYKNLVLQLTECKTKEERIKIVAEFDIDLKARKEREAKAAKIKADSEELQRKLNQERNRERHERMMEMKEKNRVKQERMKERERVKEEMKKFRENQAEISRARDVQRAQERKEERYLLLPFSDDVPDSNFTLLIPDIMDSLSLEDKERLTGLLKEHNITENNDSTATTTTESGHTKIREDTAAIKDESNSADTAGGGTVVQNKEKEENETAEFSEYFVKFCNTELSEAEETNLIKTLIKAQKSSLLKELVIKIAKIRHVGKSKMFQVLCKKYVGNRVYDPPQEPRPEPEPETTDGNGKDDNKEEESEDYKNGKNANAFKSTTKEEVKESKQGESKDMDSLPPEPVAQDQQQPVDDAIDGGKDKTFNNQDEKVEAVETGVQGIKALPKLNNTQSSIRDNLGEQSDPNKPKDYAELEKTESKSESDKENQQNHVTTGKSKENQQNHVTTGKSKENQEASGDDGAKTSKKSARTPSIEIDLNKKPLLPLTPAEVRKRFGLKNLYVKIKKNKVLYKVYLAQLKRLGLPLPEKSNKANSVDSSVHLSSEDNSVHNPTTGPDNKDLLNTLYEPDQDKPTTSKVNAKPLANYDGKPIGNEAVVEDIKNKVDDENQSKSRPKSPVSAKSRTEARKSSRSRSRSSPRSKCRSSPRSKSKSSPRSRSKSRSSLRSRSRSRSRSFSGSRSSSSSRSVSRSRSRSKKSRSRSKTRS